MCVSCHVCVLRWLLLTAVVSHAHLLLSLQKQIVLCCDDNLKFYPDEALNIEKGLSSEREGGAQ